VTFQLDVFVQGFAYFSPSKLLESAGQVAFELIMILASEKKKKRKKKPPRKYSLDHHGHIN